MGLNQEEVIVKLGLDNTKLKSGADESDAFMRKFEKKLTGRIDKTLMGIFGLGIVSLVKNQIENLVDAASAGIARLAFKIGVQEQTGKNLDKERSRFRQANLERWKAELEAIKKADKILKEVAEEDKLRGQIAEADLKERTQKMGENTDAALEMKKKFYDADVRIAQSELDSLKNSTDKIAILKAQLDLENAKLKAMDAQQDITKKNKDKIGATVSGVPQASVDRLKAINEKIVQDSINVTRYNNQRNQGVLAVDLRERARLMGGISGQMVQQQKPAESIADKMTKDILEGLAKTILHIQTED